MNANRDRDKAPKPIDLPKPFLLDDEPEAPTQEEYEYARTMLRTHSMFGDR